MLHAARLVSLPAVWVYSNEVWILSWKNQWMNFDFEPKYFLEKGISCLPKKKGIGRKLK